MWDPTRNNSGFTSPDELSGMLNVYGRHQQFTPEQMKWLQRRLTLEDRTELANMSSSCLREVSWSRGIPTAAATVMVLYGLQKFKIVNWAPRQRMIIWGTFPVMTALMADGYFISRHPCGRRIQDHLRGLYQKYSTLESAQQQKQPNRLTYAQLREANRAGHPFTFDSTDKYFENPVAGNEITQQTDDVLKEKRNYPQKFKEPAAFMSGTPLIATDDLQMTNKRREPAEWGDYIQNKKPDQDTMLIGGDEQSPQTKDPLNPWNERGVRQRPSKINAANKEGLSF